MDNDDDERSTKVADGEVDFQSNPPPQTDGRIAMAVTICLEGFRELLVILTQDNSTSEAAFRTFRDEETRFKVWSGNIGAHKKGRSSLDYRLRDASHLQKQVLRLLEDLRALLEDARAILRGDEVPWDKLDEDPLREGETSECSETELDQISTDVFEVVNCLLRLSVSIRNPAPHDRFRASANTETDYYVPFDIQHVQSKFGSTTSDLLAERLGKAISRRRQYFRYRENHHAKLMHGLDPDQKDEPESTVASSIPHHIKDPGAAATTQVVDEDTHSDTGVSETSFASSAAGTARLRLPPLPKESQNGPFECPFCFMIIAATNTISWKRHVYGDLRPYVCLSEDCETPDQEFVRRRDWMQHEIQNHWKTYSCPLGCPEESTKFTSATSLKTHLTSNHKSQVSVSQQLDALIDLSARPIRMENGVTCRLCGEILFSIQTYRRHVGRHQEQISLFALPNIAQACDDDDSTDDNESTETDGDGDGDVDFGHLSPIISLGFVDDVAEPFVLPPIVHRRPGNMDVDDKAKVEENDEDDISSDNGSPPPPASRHANTLPISGDGYEYTRPSDLARYYLALVLNPERPSRPGKGILRRQTSMEEEATRGRSPPSPLEEGLPYHAQKGRPRARSPPPSPSRHNNTADTTSPTNLVFQNNYDDPQRRGPPPTTWGLEKMEDQASAPSEPQESPAPEPAVLPVTPQDPGPEQPAVTGILKKPTLSFPEELNPVREGVAPHKEDKSKIVADVPAGARWTKISRKMVNPEALTIGKERFEVRDDFVIVLRVLSREEVQAYSQATAALRERRRQKYEKKFRRVKYSDEDDDHHRIVPIFRG